MVGLHSQPLSLELWKGAWQEGYHEGEGRREVFAAERAPAASAAAAAAQSELLDFGTQPVVVGKRFLVAFVGVVFAAEPLAALASQEVVFGRESFVEHPAVEGRQAVEQHWVAVELQVVEGHQVVVSVSVAAVALVSVLFAAESPLLSLHTSSSACHLLSPDLGSHSGVVC